MKFRVIYKVEYAEARFDFDTMEAAGTFAEAILKHQVPNEKGLRQSVRIILLQDGEEEE